VNRRTLLYVVLVSAIAAVLLASDFFHLKVPDPVRFGGFLWIALTSSAFKVRIPHVSGIYSLNFIVMLAAITEFSRGESLLIALGCAVAQSYWRAAHRPKLIQVVFNCSNLVISISGAYAIYHTSWFWPEDWVFLSAALAALGFYILNTGLTSVVLCMEDGQGFRRVWVHWNVYTLQYYLLGSTLSCIWTLASQQVPWRGIPLLALPLYVIFLVFRRFVSSQEAAQQGH
jgi:hypothetical protein